MTSSGDFVTLFLILGGVMTDKQLIKEAMKARNNSYSPYSGYKVGAAVLTKSGKVFYGTNVENCSYGATICAERSALVGAISHGEKDIVALALVGSSTDKSDRSHVVLWAKEL